mmetsp:Transcript_15991/g.21826  ORF Transcript_15991/g.21826 Transcript_15991/m.21826 type:complete len:1670 (-) Transcript_15991:145-5154(-)
MRLCLDKRDNEIFSLQESITILNEKELKLLQTVNSLKETIAERNNNIQMTSQELNQRIKAEHEKVLKMEEDALVLRTELANQVQLYEYSRIQCENSMHDLSVRAETNVAYIQSKYDSSQQELASLRSESSAIKNELQNLETQLKAFSVAMKLFSDSSLDFAIVDVGMQLLDNPSLLQAKATLSRIVSDLTATRCEKDKLLREVDSLSCKESLASKSNAATTKALQQLSGFLNAQLENVLSSSQLFGTESQFESKEINLFEAVEVVGSVDEWRTFLVVLSSFCSQTNALSLRYRYSSNAFTDATKMEIQLRNDIGSLKHSLENSDASLKVKIKELQTALADIEELQNRIRTVNDSLTISEDDIKSLSVLRDQLQSELSIEKCRTKSLLKELDELKRILSLANNESDKMKVILVEKEALLLDLIAAKNRLLQEATDKDMKQSSILQELALAAERYQQLENERCGIQQELRYAVNDKIKMQNEINRIKIMIAELQQDVVRLSDGIQQRDGEIANLRQASSLSRIEIEQLNCSHADELAVVQQSLSDSQAKFNSQLADLSALMEEEQVRFSEEANRTSIEIIQKCNEIEVLKSEISRLQSQLDESSIRCKDIDVENDMLRKQAIHANEVLLVARNQLQAMTAEVAEKDSRINTLLEECAASRKSKRDFESRLEASGEALTTKEEEFQKTFSTIEFQLHEVHSQLQLFSADAEEENGNHSISMSPESSRENKSLIFRLVAKCTRKIQKMGQEKEALQSKIKEKNSEIDDLQCALSAAQTKTANIASQLERYRSDHAKEVSTFEHELHSRQLIIKEANSRIQSAMEDKTILELKNKELKSQCDVAKNEIEQLTEQLEELQSGFNAVVESRRSLQLQIGAMTKDYQTLGDSRNVELSKLQSELSEKAIELSRCTAELRQSRSKLASLQSEIVSLQLNIADQTNAANTMSTSHNELRLELELLQNDMRGAIREKSNLENQLEEIQVEVQEKTIDLQNSNAEIEKLRVERQTLALNNEHLLNKLKLSDENMTRMVQNLEVTKSDLSSKIIESESLFKKIALLESSIADERNSSAQNKQESVATISSKDNQILKLQGAVDILQKDLQSAIDDIDRRTDEIQSLKKEIESLQSAFHLSKIAHQKEMAKVVEYMKQTKLEQQESLIMLQQFKTESSQLLLELSEESTKRIASVNNQLKQEENRTAELEYKLADVSRIAAKDSDAATSRWNDLKKDLETLKIQHANILNSKQHELQSVYAELQSLTTELELYKNLAADSKTELGKLRLDSTNFEKKATGELLLLRDELAICQQQLKAAQIKHEKDQQATSSLLHEKDQAFTAVVEELENVCRHKADLSDELNQCKSRMTAADKELAELSDIITHKTTDLDSALALIEKLRDERNTLTNSLAREKSDLNQKLENLYAELSHVREDSTNQTHHSNELMQVLSMQTSEFQNLCSENNTLKDNYRQLQEGSTHEISRLQRDLTFLNQAFNNRGTEMNDLIKEMDLLKHKQRASEQEVSRLNETVGQLKRQLEIRQQELQGLRDEGEDLRKRLDELQRLLTREEDRHKQCSSKLQAANQQLKSCDAELGAVRQRFSERDLVAMEASQRVEEITNLLTIKAAEAEDMTNFEIKLLIHLIKNRKKLTLVLNNNNTTTNTSVANHNSATNLSVLNSSKYY